MGLPPVTSAVFLIANFGKTWLSLRNIWDTSATPSGIKREWYVYVCIYVIRGNSYFLSFLITSLCIPEMVDRSSVLLFYSPTNTHWARVVGYGPFFLCVIHKEGLCPSSWDINRLMMIVILLVAFYYIHVKRFEWFYYIRSWLLTHIRFFIS
jgi:hypothetical protein